MCEHKKTKKVLIEGLRALRFRAAELQRVKAEDKRVNAGSGSHRISEFPLCIGVVLISICLLFTGLARAQTEHKRKVLILNSYHAGYFWTDEIVKAIRAEFDRSGLDVELTYEYMDTKRYDSDGVFPYLKNLYKSKYRNVNFDVIIATDNSALVFLVRYRNLLSPGSPIVFCGVGGFKDSMIRDRSGITGVVEEIDIKGTIELALRLHPRTKRIAVISDDTGQGVILLRRVREIQPQFEQRVEFIELAGLTTLELKESLGRLPDDTVVLFLSFFIKRAVTIPHSIALVSENCDLPIYSLWDRDITHGVLGGVVKSGLTQGQSAARIAIRILNGESADSIPVVRKSPNPTMMDYSQMKRFGISRSQLPEGSIIINEPESFYYRYKTWIWMVVGIIAALTAMVIILSVNTLWRKRAEAGLRQSEEKYRSVVENIGIGVSLISPKMEILALNRQLRQWFPNIDVSKKPICYKTFNKPAREDICSYCPTYKSLKDGQVHESITETPAGNKIINYRIISSPIKDKDGRVVAAIEMVEDITEQKKAEEALRESEERYKGLFQGSGEGILVADIETKEFKYANPALCRMLGYTEEELKRMSVFDLHPKDALEHVISEFEAQARGEKTLAPNIPCLQKDGTTIYADVNTARVLIDGRECNVGFFTDITERKRTEEALQKAYDELEARVEQRTAELAKAIKELQNEIAERKQAEDKLLDYQKQLRSLASELSLAEERLRRRIATDVHDHIGQNLAISKIKIESLRELVSSPKLGDTLDEIHDLIAQTIESTRTLTFELSPPVLYELGFEAAIEWLVKQIRQQHKLSTKFKDDGLPKALDNDVRVLLFQAVRELLVNVAKHARANNVAVSTRRVGDEMQVNVEDDGVGFDTSEAGSYAYKTGGFGLFSIRERLSHIGGRLDIESKPGAGTLVTLMAPINHKNQSGKGKRR